jgi:hypothetical protein
MAYKGTMIAPPDVESRNDSYPVFEPGGYYYNPETGKSYRYVKVVGGTPTVGACAYWSSSGNSAGSTFTCVTAAAASSAGFTGTTTDVAGVWTTAASSGNWTFIQTGGTCLLTYGSASIGKGNQLVSNGNASNASGGTFTGVAPGTAITTRLVGFALEDKNASNKGHATLVLE